MKNLTFSKSLAAVITAATIAMSLTACGSQATTASTEANTASTEAVAAADNSEEFTLDFDSTESAPNEEKTETPAPAASSEAAAQDDAAPASSEAAPEAEEESDETNKDITAGETDADGNYTCSAVLGDGTVDASVDALGSSIVTKDFSNVSPMGDKGSVAIKDARLAYLTVQNDGDKDAAKDDLEDYDASAPSAAMLTEIKKYADDMGKLFAQFGVEAYDLSSPYDGDSDYVEYDVFTKDGKNCFLVDFNFENGKLSEITFSQE